MSVAVRIDISEELAAIQRGECGGCRIGSTHPWHPACDATPRENVRYPQELCPECGTLYSPSMLGGEYRGVGCPECYVKRRDAHVPA